VQPSQQQPVYPTAWLDAVRFHFADGVRLYSTVLPSVGKLF